MVTQPKPNPFPALMRRNMLITRAETRIQCILMALDEHLAEMGLKFNSANVDTDDDEKIIVRIPVSKR